MSFELVGVKLVAEEGSYFSTMAKADKAVVNFGDTADRTFRQMPSLADIATGALHRIGTMAVDVFLQAGQAAVGFITDSIGAAGDFEAGMNRFSAVAGQSIQDAGLELKDFRDQFIQIGKELPVSTAEVQEAAIEMAKGGIEPATIAAGGLKQVIQFAAAADLDLAQASTIAAKALGGWTDMAASADEKAKFLAHSTDLLQKAANASTVNVDELALGLYNVQGTAKLAGVSFDETVTALAQLAPAFGSSADAGTSFKVFLSRLQPSTKPATEAMQELGLMFTNTVKISEFLTRQGIKPLGDDLDTLGNQFTEFAAKNGWTAKETAKVWGNFSQSKFYDVKGEFIGMSNAAGILQDATKNLSEAQRVQTLQAIFGQDAIRVAAILSEQGATGYNNMADALAKQNSVADAAAQKQAGFNTALDNFKGSVEALQITIGTVLLPVLADLFNNYLAPGINILTDLAAALFGDEDAFNRLAPVVQGFLTAAQTIYGFVSENIIPILSGLATALVTIVVPAFITWATAAGAAAVATITALLPVIAPIVAIGAAVAVLVKIWESDWLGIRTAVTDFWNQYGKPIFNQLVNWLSVTIPAAIRVLADFWNNTLLPALTVIWNFISTKLAPLFMALVKVEIALMVAAVKSLAALWTDLLAPAIEVVYEWFNTYMIPEFQAANENIAIVAGAIRDTLGPAFNWLGDHVLNPVVDWFSNINEHIESAIGWLNRLADTIRNLPSLPDAFVGHSPPPMADWFNAIGTGAANAAIGIGAMGSTVQSIPANPMALMAGGSTANTYNNQRNVNLNYQTTYAPPVNQSLAIARALA